MAYTNQTFSYPLISGTTRNNGRYKSTAFPLNDEYFVAVHNESNPVGSFVSVFHCEEKIGNGTPIHKAYIPLDTYAMTTVIGHKLSENRFVIIYQGATSSERRVKCFEYDGTNIVEIASYTFTSYGFGTSWTTNDDNGRYYRVHVISEDEFLFVHRGSLTASVELSVTIRAFKIDFDNGTLKETTFSTSFPHISSVYSAYYYDIYICRIPDSNNYFITRMTTNNSYTSYAPVSSTGLFEIYFDESQDKFVIDHASTDENKFYVDTQTLGFFALDKDNIFMIDRYSRKFTKWIGGTDENNLVLNSFGEFFEIMRNDSAGSSSRYEFVKINENHFIAVGNTLSMRSNKISFRICLKVDDTFVITDELSKTENGYYKSMTGTEARAFFNGDAYYYENGILMIFYSSSNTTSSSGCGIMTFRAP